MWKGSRNGSAETQINKRSMHKTRDGIITCNKNTMHNFIVKTWYYCWMPVLLHIHTYTTLFSLIFGTAISTSFNIMFH